MFKKQRIDLLKEFIGEMPLTAELYWYLRQAGDPPPGSFSLKELKTCLINWKEDIPLARPDGAQGKHVFLFARFGSGYLKQP